MTTAEIHKFVSEPVEIEAVKWTGDGRLAKILMKAGWIEGADQGFDRDNEGPNVLRALCKSKQGIVNGFPGDILIREDDGGCYPCHPEVFEQRWKHKGLVRTLTDGQDDSTAPIRDIEPDLREHKFGVVRNDWEEPHAK